LNLFSESLKINLKILFFYRFDFVLSLLLDPIILIFKILIFKAIYDYNHTDVILGYTYSQMIWYFAGINFIYYLVWNDIDNSLGNSILSGHIVLQLSKPVSIINWELAKTASYKIGGILFQFLPSFIIYTIIIFPKFLTALAVLKFFILCIFAFFLFYLLNFLIGTTAFVLKSIVSIQQIKFILLNFAAGIFLPIDFYPEIIQQILKFTPFPYVCYIPIQFLLNQPVTAGWNYFMMVVLIQLVWIGLLYLLCHVCWRRLVKLFCAPGG
jgi:ABC-2 type transport system permease protein